jgi:hypothetical protein
LGSGSEGNRQAQDTSGCDYVFQHRGDYPITAVSYVNISWSGAGKASDPAHPIQVTVDRTGTFHVGEWQVVAHSNP